MRVPELDETAIPVRVERDESDVVPAVAAVLPERVEAVMLNDLLDAECLLVGVGRQYVVVADAREPRVLVQVVGEAVCGRQEQVRRQDGRGAHEQRLAAPAILRLLFS